MYFSPCALMLSLFLFLFHLLNFFTIQTLHFCYKSKFQILKIIKKKKKEMLRLQYFYNKSQIIRCYWFKFETNIKIIFLPQ